MAKRLMIARSSLTSKFRWTTGVYFASIAVRFATSVALSRLLGPEILGVLVVAQSVRVGAELIGDIGIEQNIINNRHGDDEAFLNTAWTMQLLRGALLSLLCLAASPFLADLYGIPLAVMLAISAAPAINALASTAIFTLAKQGDAKRRNLFELAAETAGLLINIALAFAMPTVWAPVLGLLLTLLCRVLMSYTLPQRAKYLTLHADHRREILHFGKWIMLSSAAFYAAVYIDRLFLGWAVELSVLGVYGLARAIADLPTALAGRLAYTVISPVVAADRDRDDTAGRPELTRVRRRFLLMIAVSVATVMAWSDRVVLIIYDSRYEQAGWMLATLLVGSWISVLSSLNDAVVIGRRPHVSGFANWVRMLTLMAALPLGLASGGLPGAILALAVAEAARYLTLLLAQRSMRMSFAPQDAMVSLLLIGVLALWIGLRLNLGLGTAWALMR